MNIPAQIEEAERLYKSTLEEFLLRTISGVNLESHGIDHHRRVWAFAREIISSPGFISPAEENGFVKKLLIASYLHDSGMVIDTGPRHGIHSRSFCEKYLTGNGERIENFIDLLDAIELHDNKDYRSKAAGSYLEVILNVADDLDAFGYIGIYRYLEIYLERKRDYKTIGEEIRNNAENRFRNIENILKSHAELMSIHKIRYLALDTFFRSYISEAGSYSFGNGTPSGYCGIAELIGESVHRRTSLKELLLKSTDSKQDKIINHFFTGLSKEITHFSYGL